MYAKVNLSVVCVGVCECIRCVKISQPCSLQEGIKKTILIKNSQVYLFLSVQQNQSSTCGYLHPANACLLCYVQDTSRKDINIFSSHKTQWHFYLDTLVIHLFFLSFFSMLNVFKEATHFRCKFTVTCRNFTPPLVQLSASIFPLASICQSFKSFKENQNGVSLPLMLEYSFFFRLTSTVLVHFIQSHLGQFQPI